MDFEYDFKKPTIVDKLEYNEENIDIDLATKNIKRRLEDTVFKKGRKRKELIEYEKYLNKDKIINNLEEAKKIYERINFDKKYFDSLDKKIEERKIFLKEDQFTNYVKLITKKNIDENWYENIFMYIDKIKLNIFFSIFVINYIENFKSKSISLENFLTRIKNNELEILFENIKNVNDEKLIEFLNLKKISLLDIKRFLIVFYYYYNKIEIFFF